MAPNKVIIILISLVTIFALCGIGSVYYKKTNNKTENLQEGSQETLNSAFKPSLLDWQEVTSAAAWQGRDSHAVVVYKDKLWLMG